MKRYLYRNSEVFHNNVLGSQIVKYRLQKGWSQVKLAQEIAIALGSENVLSEMAISAYENGTKIPPLTNLIGISKALEVGIDVLLSRSQQKVNAVPKISDEDELDEYARYDIQIQPCNYARYHDKPVYVRSTDISFLPQWGILDFTNRRVTTRDGVVSLNPTILIYRYEPLEHHYFDLQYQTFHSMTSLMECEICKVRMINAMNETSAYYNGWYRNDTNLSCLINMANGATLPYAGLGRSYVALKDD